VVCGPLDKYKQENNTQSLVRGTPEKYKKEQIVFAGVCSLLEKCKFENRQKHYFCFACGPRSASEIVDKYIANSYQLLGICGPRYSTLSQVHKCYMKISQSFFNVVRGPAITFF
jgi:hypothetical protein